MELQLNQTAIGAFLGRPSERLSGRIMRDFSIYMEFVSPCDQIFSFSKPATLIIKDSAGKISFTVDKSLGDSKYKLYANQPVFLHYEFFLEEKEWLALLNGKVALMNIRDEYYDISTIIPQLIADERFVDDAQ